MNIEKLPSGSYRIRKMYKGKLYLKTLPYKPTNKEAIKIMAELFDTANFGEMDGYSVGYYFEQYLNYCRNRTKPLSPSTIKNYGSIVRNFSDHFKSKRFHDLTENDIRSELNSYNETRSSKSTYNAKGFLRLVLAKYRPSFNWSYNLPQQEQKAEYEPNTTDIKRILDASKGTKYEIPFRLAVLGLRRGEICALNASDLLDGDVLSINKAIVLNESNLYEIKEPKTQASVRRIKIPHTLAELIRERGEIWSGNPHMINKHLHVIQDRLSIPRFKLHMMRHFAVAYLHKEGFTSEQIMAYGGWSTDAVMKRAYRYNLNPEESQKAISDKFDALG